MSAWVQRDGLWRYCLGNPVAVFWVITADENLKSQLVIIQTHFRGARKIWSNMKEGTGERLENLGQLWKFRNIPRATASSSSMIADQDLQYQGKPTTSRQHKAHNC